MNPRARTSPIPPYDLHVHTPFSDGQHSIDAVLQYLGRLGVKIVGFADHCFPFAMYKHKGAGLSNMYSARRLHYRKAVIRFYDRKYPGIRVLNGVEVDVYPHGGLALPRGITPAFFDYLLVSKHHTPPFPVNVFKDAPKLERWLWRYNPRLRLHRSLWHKGLAACFQRFQPDVFAHPDEHMPKYMTTADYKRLIAALTRHGVAYELNHFRLARHRAFLPLAKKYGVKFSIGSDFHGFHGRLHELEHSRAMRELAEEHELELLDPRPFLSPAP